MRVSIDLVMYLSCRVWEESVSFDFRVISVMIPLRLSPPGERDIRWTMALRHHMFILRWPHTHSLLFCRNKETFLTATHVAITYLYVLCRCEYCMIFSHVSTPWSVQFSWETESVSDGSVVVRLFIMCDITSCPVHVVLFFFNMLNVHSCWWS